MVGGAKMLTGKRPCPLCKGKAMTFKQWFKHMAAKHGWTWTEITKRP